MAKTKIVFLVLPHVHLLDLAGPMQVFHEAIFFGADITMEYCSLGETTLPTSSDFPLGKLMSFRKTTLAAGDYLFVPGADMKFLLSKKLGAEKELIRWVKNAYEQGAYVGSICTGAFFLAQTGLLDGRRCTTHWKFTSKLKARYPLINMMEDVLFTEDDRVFTSAGVTAGVDLALHIVSRLQDDSLSFKVARELVVYVRRNGSESQQSVFMQYRNHIHSGIHRVQDYVQDHLHQMTSLPVLSEVACMSTRTLTRTFKRETGVTVNEYLNLVRRARLKELMKNPDHTRRQLARYCGLTSERQVIRLLKQ
jgi:transcriptional regulator GlxA family with amidase domain